MPRDWWWGVAANALGTVLGAVVLGVLVGIAAWSSSVLRRYEDGLNVSGYMVVGGAIGLLLFSPVGPEGMSDLWAGALLGMLLLGILMINVRPIGRLLRQLAQTKHGERGERLIAKTGRRRGRARSHTGLRSPAQRVRSRHGR